MIRHSMNCTIFVIYLRFNALSIIQTINWSLNIQFLQIIVHLAIKCSNLSFLCLLIPSLNLISILWSTNINLSHQVSAHLSIQPITISISWHKLIADSYYKESINSSSYATCTISSKTIRIKTKMEILSPFIIN